MSAASLLSLSSGPLLLLLAPDVGGSIARFDHRTEQGEKIPIFRGVDSTDDGPAANILDRASFPLVPFCNRIRGGGFRFRNRKVTLSENLPGEASPIHGQGWLNPWEVVSAGPAGAELRFRHRAGEWPWAYEAQQRFELDDAGLTVVLSCTNQSEGPMPCGLGQHPYLPCTAETRLDTEAAWVWTTDEQLLPVTKVPAEGDYDLRDRRICGQGLDNGFGGWSGRARIETPAIPFAVEISSPDAPYLQIYSPGSGGFFAAEPVSHANAALNEAETQWAQLGIRLLEPEETMSFAMRVAVVPVEAR
jgi:aldose 1-epimerase